jgi:hypothetical protein
MKTISYILSLVLPDLKSEYIYMQLLFISLLIKAGWLLLAGLLSHAMKMFKGLHRQHHMQVTGRLSLCH